MVKLNLIVTIRKGVLTASQQCFGSVSEQLMARDKSDLWNKRLGRAQGMDPKRTDENSPFIIWWACGHFNMLLLLFQ